MQQRVETVRFNAGQDGKTYNYNYNINVLVSEFGEKRRDWVITKESEGEGFKSHCFWEQIVQI